MTLALQNRVIVFRVQDGHLVDSLHRHVRVEPDLYMNEFKCTGCLLNNTRLLPPSVHSLMVERGAIGGSHAAQSPHATRQARSASTIAAASVAASSLQVSASSPPATSDNSKKNSNTKKKK